MSTSIEAPAAFARSDGLKELTKGTATAAAPAPPTAQDVISQLRRLLSTLASLMQIFLELGSTGMTTPRVNPRIVVNEGASMF